MALPFEFFRNVATRKILTVDPDGFLRQYPHDPGNRNQHWLRLLHQNTPAQGFKVISRTSSQVVDAQGGNLIDYTPLQRYPFNGGDNQRWRLVDAGGDRVFYIHAADTDEVWDVPNGNPADGTLVQLYRRNGGDNQRWEVRPAEGFDNVFKVVSPASGLVLDVPGFLQVDGGYIQQYRDTGGFNQLWEFRQRDGHTAIKSICSGKLLDYPLQPALNREPAFVGQYDDNGGDNQKWDIVRLGQDAAGNDIVNIASALNGFFLDVPGGSNVEGEHIQAYRDNGGGANQRWVLVNVF
jgi:hypothetical protein